MADLRAKLARPWWGYVIFTVPLILGLGMLSGWLSNSGYGNNWFDALTKPATMPPGWVFGAAWTVLYMLLGIAIALILQARGAPGWGIAMALFTVQMLLNYSWSPVFFGAGEAKTALFIIILMQALTIAIIFLFFRIDRRAAWLMLPYAGWLAFASHLNYQIIQLNPGA